MNFADLLAQRRKGYHLELEPLRVSLIGRIKNVDCIVYKQNDDLRGVLGLDVSVFHAGEAISRTIDFLDALLACKPWCVDLINVLTGQQIAITRCGDKRLKEIIYASNPL